MRRSRLSCVLAVQWWLGLAACAEGHMVVPPDVARDSDLLVVTDRFAGSGLLVDESFKLGRYAIDDVSRRLIPSGRYTFTFKGQQAVRQGTCSYRTHRPRVLALPVGERSTTLYCACTEDALTNLRLTRGDSGSGGSLRLRDAVYTIAAIEERSGDLTSYRGPSGYRIDGAQPMAAVEVIHPGRIWLAKTIADPFVRESLTCVLSGVLLLPSPSDRTP